MRFGHRNNILKIERNRSRSGYYPVGWSGLNDESPVGNMRVEVKLDFQVVSGITRSHCRHLSSTVEKEERMENKMVVREGGSKYP